MNPETEKCDCGKYELAGVAVLGIGDETHSQLACNVGVFSGQSIDGGVANPEYGSGVDETDQEYAFTPIGGDPNA